MLPTATGTDDRKTASPARLRRVKRAAVGPRSPPLLFAAPGLLAALVLLLGACGGGGEQPSPVATVIAGPATATVGPAGELPRTTATATSTPVPTEPVVTAQAPVISEVEAVSGVEVAYADDGEPKHVMLVYIPEGDGPFPALVLIHGGGWARGSPAGMAGLAKAYAADGIAAFSLAYRLTTPEQPSWPASVQDVVCAVRHIRANAGRYRIDPDRIGAWGGSAGAHLAGMIGTLEGDEPLLDGACGDPAVGHDVVLVVSRSGPLDLEVMGSKQIGAVPIFERFLGASYADDPQRYRDASPHTYLSADDPPFLIIHGTADQTVPAVSATSFAEQFEAAGGEVHLFLVEGGEHMVPNPAEAQATLDTLTQRLLRP